MKKLIIFGTGELAELSHYYFSHDSDYEVVAFCLDSDFIYDRQFLGLEVIDFEGIEERFSPEDYEMFIAVGYKNMNETRKLKYNAAKAKGYTLASYISSSCKLWPDFNKGENQMIMEGTVIMPFSKLGNNVLVWVDSILSHHSIIEDHVCITSHCAIGGKVIIGSQAFIGLNATIRDGVKVGSKALIGAGASLMKDAKENGVYLGNPAQLTSNKSTDFL
ncbi:acetyltransferase [bacterium]|nr:acetyltransferase [bacterium]